MKGILSTTGSQLREQRSGALWENIGRLKPLELLHYGWAEEVGWHSQVDQPGGSYISPGARLPGFGPRPALSSGTEGDRRGQKGTEVFRVYLQDLVLAEMLAVKFSWSSRLTPRFLPV